MIRGAEFYSALFPVNIADKNKGISMEKIEIFQVLGIESTKDEQAIKNAYREKLAVTNPEDNPEGFKRLRTAFEEACRLAKMPEDTEEVEEEKDTTPSGLWVEKVAEIYKDITKRRDANQWKELFEEDIFLSLEEEENCRYKLLGFLMDHYNLPTGIWKLLDEKINIVNDKEQLRESFPADFISFIASKCERGENVEFEQFEGAPDAPYDLFLQYYDQCYRAMDKGDLEQAKTFVDNADELNIFHPIMELCRAELLEKQGEVQEAIALLQALDERFPKDVMVAYNCAEMMWRNGQKAEAVKRYERLKEENDSHYMSNVRLSEWYYDQKRYRDAKQAAEKVLSAGGDRDFRDMLVKINHEIEHELESQYHEKKDYETGLELCWCYLQDGKVWRGIKLAESLSDRIPKERDSEYKGLLTKLYIEMTEYEKTLEMSEAWEKALQERLASEESEEDREKDEERVRQAHTIRMHCYRAQAEMKGTYSEEERTAYYNRALAEAETLEKGTSQDIGVLMDKARIYMDMGEYDKCLDVTRKLILDYQVYAAYAIETECYRKEWNAGGVIQAGRRCIDYFPTYVCSYEYMAKVYLDLEHKEELLELLEEAEQNGVKSVLLNAYRYQVDHEIPDIDTLNAKLDVFRKEYTSKVEDGKLEYYEKGLPIITEYLYWYPDSYMMVERALFHRNAHHYQEAIEDFEKVLAEVPNQQYALLGLAHTYKYMGDYEKALNYIKRVVRYRDEDMSNYVYANMAQIYSLMGEPAEAKKAYDELLKRDKEACHNGYHMKKYAMALANCGETDKAIEVLRTAHSKDRAMFYFEAVDIYQLVGEVKKANNILAEWKRLIKNTPSEKMEPYQMADYLLRSAWQELMYGSKRRCLRLFDKLLKVKGDDKGAQCDACFAATLCGDDKRGKRYAAMIRESRRKEKEEGIDTYFDQEKGRLHRDIFADFYELSDEEMEKLLATESRCEICHFCTWSICREVEANCLVYMLRRGRKKEVLERIRRNLEKQPLDEYMIAIRHMCEGRKGKVK